MGSGDLCNCLASFGQVLRFQQAIDHHMQKDGFGLTLDSKGLSWFQTLETNDCSKLLAHKKNIIAPFLKMGIKHTFVAQIYAFA